jgi:hypothetical protein
LASGLNCEAIAPAHEPAGARCTPVEFKRPPSTRFRLRPPMTRAIELELYQPYARSCILDSLGSAVELKWGGDLAIGGGTAYVFASLTTERWQILSPDMIRREVQLPGDPVKRPKWKVTLSIPRGTFLFGQPRPRDPFLFLGEIVPTSNNGGRSLGQITSARWDDYLIKPRLPRQMWARLRFRCLYIDERIVPIDSWIGRGEANRFFRNHRAYSRAPESRGPGLPPCRTDPYLHQAARDVLPRLRERRDESARHPAVYELAQRSRCR